VIDGEGLEKNVRFGRSFFRFFSLYGFYVLVYKANQTKLRPRKNIPHTTVSVTMS